MPRWKRALDLTITLAVLLVTMPLFGALALYISIVSPGPIIFCQTRIGLRGSKFLCFKFRTMRVNAETHNHEAYLKSLMGSNAPMVKMDARNDSRLIPGAWLIRALGIDELPQLLNVLKGDMSLVGPRPCIPYEYDGYQPWQKERFAAVPGLTGLWQVSGKNRTTFDEMIHLDIRYGRRKSLLGDLRILAMTPVAVVQQYLDTKKSRATAIAATREPIQRRYISEQQVG
ncbi:MAG: sugar transferase [Nibricoccus sp.]